ncbi:MAG: ribonuclease III [Gammaproteobacteria bacterium]|nr:ribonuclease III [Gammaproteobacteria bacterium]
MNPSHDKLCRRLGYPCAREDLLLMALTHRSYGSPNNERLEFLGDAALSLIIAEILYARFPRQDEGALSRLRANLVNGEVLARRARNLDLGEELLLGPGELKSGGYRRDSILAGALEALIGAAYLESGLDAARQLVRTVLGEEIEAVSPDQATKDPKTRLQEYLQARRMPLPEYRVMTVEGQDHAQLFRVECRVTGLDEALSGEGNSRRRAEQDAAGKALQLLQESS